MRTLASTFSTREEAEAAGRRLEAIGIGRERIVLKDLVGTDPTVGAPGGAFISVKVTTDQVQPVSEILKAGRSSEDIAAAASPAAAPVAADVSPPTPARPLSPDPRPATVQPGPVQAATAQAAAKDRARLSRYLVYYGLALVAAFVIGAWLGMLG